MTPRNSLADSADPVDSADTAGVPTVDETKTVAAVETVTNLQTKVANLPAADSEAKEVLEDVLNRGSFAAGFATSVADALCAKETTCLVQPSHVTVRNKVVLSSLERPVTDGI